MIKQYTFILLCMLFFSAHGTAQTRHTFEIGKHDFFLDGKPFQIISGEMHYARVPRPYWRDRLKKARAMGLNTICTYMFWNAHEPVEGRYNFKDNLDLKEFCKEAAEEGLWIILRPGPYTCAEWDLGGLPSWLLKNEHVVLRSADTAYLPHTLRFLDRAVQEFKNSQITNGGNILMVQVENEYGEYGSDKGYLNAIKQTLRDAGVTVPLFNCDWPGKDNYDRGHIDGVMPSINFGGQAQRNFETFSRYAPDVPRFNSEFWTGWFDYWGGKHEVHAAKEKLADFKWMIDNGVSVNLYMFHGGTSNGFFSGANGSDSYFTPYITSYDYDAPLSESGEPNDKFLAFRNVILQKYPDLKLPPLPAATPKIAIPEFQLYPVASLKENLPSPRLFGRPQNMEALDQDYGMILYAHDLVGQFTGELQIKRVMDRAIVYLDGKKIGILDRRLNQSTINVNSGTGKHRLEILVEALGRVNFGSAIDHERKGITEGVYLNGTELKGWEHYPLPLQNISSFKPSAVHAGYPEFYQGRFSISKKGDTFLDTRNLDNGLLWLNGKMIGRYWMIGPQQTLYIPGCWLKTGTNDVSVLELGNPAKFSISGLKEQVWATKADPSLLNRRKGQALHLKAEQLVQHGILEDKAGWQDIRFKSVIEGRYICLESMSAYRQSACTAIAELRLVDASGKEIPRERYTIVYADSEETETDNGLAGLLIDNQSTTNWQTRQENKGIDQPHQVVIDLGGVTGIGGFKYLPVPDGRKGRPKDYNFYVSLKNFNFK
ncbi:beta-galactosidase [Mucilaginibacter gossypiicola]|uniref:Beta-galactosidase n=1 Tax=Mucilaginibacter gossypiicola TaxID=551995 RepID=A0A1H8LRM0_9SPHI|nr:beta-galactosidase [Mucilaginibacter gossypiicola]SEO07740.1 beta-galactosidase [Mucilaginibacter gossypiicola]